MIAAAKLIKALLESIHTYQINFGEKAPLDAYWILRDMQESLEDSERDREKELEEALTEVIQWISCWSPRFTEEEEWEEALNKVECALKKDEDL